MNTSGLTRRDRAFLLATLMVAGGFAYAGHALSRYVGSMNTARVFGAVMTAPMVDPGSAQTLTGGLFGVLNNAVRMSMDQRKAQEAKRQQEAFERRIAAVEVITVVWRYFMWAIAAGLALAAVLGWWTARPRRWLLTASGAIVLSTVATLVGMWMLMAPRFGDMPPLQRRIYVYVAAAQSLWGWVLLAAYARRRGWEGGPSLAQQGVGAR